MIRGRIVRIAAVVAALVVPVSGVAHASSGGASGGSRAAQVDAPFDQPGALCLPHTGPANRNTSAPGVTPNQIVVADISEDTEALKRLGFNVFNYDGVFKGLFKEINEKCGGINGRKVVLKFAPRNAVAVDQAGHQQALCLKITEDWKAFAMVGLGGHTSHRCVAVQHKTIAFANSAGPTSTDFKDSKGRIFTITVPAVDKLAAAFIADGIAQNTFKGKKVAVVGALTSATAVAEQQDQYVDEFKRRGIDVDFEVLPCVATVCTQGVPTVVNRLIAKDIDVIVITQHVQTAGEGALLGEMAKRGLKATVTGPDFPVLHQDTAVASAVRAGGTTGSAWGDRYGWTSVGPDPRGDWRTGGTKPTKVGLMCADAAGRALGQPAKRYIPSEYADWLLQNQQCATVRALARAIYQAGANVTTERVVANLKALKYIDRPETARAGARDKFLYSDGDYTPTTATTNVFQYPCALPTLATAGTAGCFVPIDRPARIRKVRL